MTGRFGQDGNFSEIEPGLFVGGSMSTPPPGTKAVLNLCEIEDPYQAEVHRWMKIPDAEPAPDLDWLKEAVGCERSRSRRRAGKIGLRSLCWPGSVGPRWFRRRT